MNRFRLLEVSEAENNEEMEKAFKTIIEASQAVFITAAVNMAGTLIAHTTDGSHTPITHEVAAYILVAQFIEDSREAGERMQRELDALEVMASSSMVVN